MMHVPKLASSEDVELVHWLCANTKPNAHRIAERNLARQGYRTFLPQVKETVRRAGQFKQAVVPLFPGYIFVGLDAWQSWSPINATLGVVRLVSFHRDGAPAEVPGGFIAALHARCGDQGLVAVDPGPPIGTHVAVREGPFAGHVGLVVGLKSNQRVALLMSLFGQEVTVTAPIRGIVSQEKSL
jgi:transcriptional antiterminator RfaH